MICAPTADGRFDRCGRSKGHPGDAFGLHPLAGPQHKGVVVLLGHEPAVARCRPVPHGGAVELDDRRVFGQQAEEVGGPRLDYLLRAAKSLAWASCTSSRSFRSLSSPSCFCRVSRC